MQVHHNLANLYSRTGHFADAWKAYEFSLQNKYEPMDQLAGTHAMFAMSLAQGGNPPKAVEEGLISARMSREMFVLQARTIAERQALGLRCNAPARSTRPSQCFSVSSELPTQRDLSGGHTFARIGRRRNGAASKESERRQRP